MKANKIEKPELIVNHITKWIQNQILNAGATTAVVGLSGGADSALVAILCKIVFPDMVAVRMPCDSSPESLSRAEELAKKFDIKMITVDLVGAFDDISGQVLEGLEKTFEDSGKAGDGALRSCLRAPTLDYVAKLVNGLIVGTGNRDEDKYVRYYQKRGDGAVDISPIAELHKSEVYELLEYLECPQSIIDATPSADLWGGEVQEDEKELGMTYKELEWATKFLVANKDCTLEAIAELNEREVAVLTKVIKLEKATRHKAEMPPVCELRWYIDVWN